MSRLFLRVWLVLSAVVVLTAVLVLWAARPGPLPPPDVARLPPPFARPEVLASLAALWTVGAGLVYALLRPLRREVRALQAASRQLATGDWGARARLGPEALLFDVGHSLDDLARRVGELDRNRDELVRNVSHELRTPVSRVAFAVDLLASEADPVARKRRSEAIAADLAELESLVAELLAWSSLGERPRAVRAEPIDPLPILERIVEEAKFAGPYSGLASQERDVTFVAGPLPLVPADGKLFRRAVGNLVRNGARYASKRLQVQAAEEAGHLVLVVDDDGPGVPPDDRERIFEPFVRLDPARSRDTGGTGLGLALTRRILAAHGGHVACLPSPLGGARFVARWPLTARVGGATPAR